MGFEVVSLDKKPTCKANLCVDVMELYYKSLPVGYFDLIASSPPCQEYSAAKRTGGKGTCARQTPSFSVRWTSLNIFSRRCGGWKILGVGCSRIGRLFKGYLSLTLIIASLVTGGIANPLDSGVRLGWRSPIQILQSKNMFKMSSRHVR